MMKTIKSRFLFLLLAVMLCTTAFSVPTFADGADSSAYAVLPDGTGAVTERPVVTLIPKDPAEVETSSPTGTASPVQASAPDETPETPEESGGDDFMDFFAGFGDFLTAFTPDGNLSLIDDFLFSGMNDDGEKEEKQFITVQSKSGAYFFIIIDRAGDTENVYFLNMVDEADLFALMDDGEETEPEPPVCTCEDKCYAGHVDTTCSVCAVNMAACAGKEPEPEPSPEPTEPVEPDTPDKPGTEAVGLVVLLILAAVGGAAYYVLKVRGKAKPKTKGDTDLDDYDYGEDGDESENEYAEFDRSEETDGNGEPYYPEKDGAETDDPGGGYWPDSGGEGPDE